MESITGSNVVNKPRKENDMPKKDTEEQIDYEVSLIELFTAAGELEDARKVLNPMRLIDAKKNLVACAHKCVAAEKKFLASKAGLEGEMGT